MFESINVADFLRTPGVLFHTEGQMKQNAFCRVLVFKKDKLISDSYLLFLNSSDKVIQKLHSGDWGIY